MTKYKGHYIIKTDVKAEGKYPLYIISSFDSPNAPATIANAGMAYMHGIKSIAAAKRHIDEMARA